MIKPDRFTMLVIESFGHIRTLFGHSCKVKEEKTNNKAGTAKGGIGTILFQKQKRDSKLN